LGFSVASVSVAASSNSAVASIYRPHCSGGIRTHVSGYTVRYVSANTTPHSATPYPNSSRGIRTPVPGYGNRSASATPCCPLSGENRIRTGIPSLTNSSVSVTLHLPNTNIISDKNRVVNRLEKIFRLKFRDRFPLPCTSPTPTSYRTRIGL
jgi:hypothetical protein